MSSPSARFEELLESSLNSDAPPKKISISSYKTTSSYTTVGAEYPFHPGNPYVPPPMPPPIPDVFRSYPVLRDEYQTKSQKDQDQTVSEVLPHITKRGNALPALKREKHIAFLESGLDEEQLPGYMVILDASRPWIVYWCLTGQSLLGVDISRYRNQ
jgi:protein farnesyltransferase subunit beta